MDQIFFKNIKDPGTPAPLNISTYQLPPLHPGRCTPERTRDPDQGRAFRNDYSASEFPTSLIGRCGESGEYLDGGDLGGHFYCRFYFERVAKKVRRITMLHFGLVAFRIRFRKI